MFNLNPSPIKTPIVPYKTYYSNYNQKMVTLPKTTFVSTPKPMNITIKPNENEYIVLIEEKDFLIEEPLDEEKEEMPTDMLDYLPQIYVGSLTVLGLYIFYRLIHKR